MPVIKLDKSNNLVYANFKSFADGLAKSNIYYKDKNYQFEIKNRGVLYFDPKNTDKKGNAIAASGDVTLTIGSKKYLTKNGFIIFLDEGGNGIIRRIDYPPGGAFVDTDYQIQATSTSKGCFSIFFGHDEDTVKYYSSKKYTLPNCKGILLTNTLWIDYNALTVQGKSAMVKLISTGQITYKYGKYTTVEGQPGSRTILIKRPGHEFYFKVTNGWAAIEKDHIRATVTNKCKTTKPTPTGYAQKIGEINKCGDNVKLHRTGIVSIITETINIVDSCGTCMYVIGPEGGIYAYNKKTNKQIGSWLNPEKSKLDYGSVYLKGSRELTILAIFDYMTEDLTNFRKEITLNGEKWYKSPSLWFEAIQLQNILDYYAVRADSPPRKSKLAAVDSINKQLAAFKMVKNFMLQGNSFEKAAEKAQLNTEFTQFLTRAVLPNGEINSGEMIALANKLLDTEIKKGFWDSNRHIMAYTVNQAYYLGTLAETALFNKKYGNYGSVFENKDGSSSLTYKFITIDCPEAKVRSYDFQGHWKDIDNFMIERPLKIGASLKYCTYKTIIKGTKDDRYNIIEAEQIRLKNIYKSEPLFKKGMVPLDYKILKIKTDLTFINFALSCVDALDLIPITKIAKLGSKGYYLTKEAIKAKGLKAAFGDFYENTLKAFVKRPYIILKDSYETLGKVKFKDEDALSRAWHCSGDCEKNIKGTVNEKIDKVMGDGTTSLEKQADKKMAAEAAKVKNYENIIHLKEGSIITKVNSRGTLYHELYQIEELATTAPDLEKIIKPGTNYLEATPDEIISLLPTKLREHINSQMIKLGEKPKLGIIVQSSERQVVFLEADGRTIIGQLNVKVTFRDATHFQAYPDIGLGSKYTKLDNLKGAGTEFVGRGLQEIKLRYSGKQGIVYSRGASLSLNNIWIGKRGQIPVREAFIRNNDKVVAVWMKKVEAQTRGYKSKFIKWNNQEGIFGYVTEPGSLNIQSLNANSANVLSAGGWKKIEKWGSPPKPYLIENAPTISWSYFQ